LELDEPPGDVDELNRRAEAWVHRRVHQVRHRTTRVPPAERFEVEEKMLRPLPASRFDTAYVDVRRVHRNVPLIEYGTVRYSVPADLLGQAVEVRRAVDSALRRPLGRHRRRHPPHGTQRDRGGVGPRASPSGRKGRSGASPPPPHRRPPHPSPTRRSSRRRWCWTATTPWKHPTWPDTASTAPARAGRVDEPLRAAQRRPRIPPNGRRFRTVRPLGRGRPNRRVVPCRIPRPGSR